MIQGTTLRETMTEIMDNARNKKDYVLSAPLIRMNDEMGLHWASATGPVTAAPSAHAHNQMADYLNIPRKFYDRLRSDMPDLIAINVNRLLDNKVGEARMVRTLNGAGRAIMSDRYRRLDNEDLAENILPRILNDGIFQVESMRVTESRFYLQIVAPRMEGEIRVGDDTRWGLSNAITQAANTHESYDRAIELERIGGDVMALEGAAWSGIAMAGAR